VAGDTQSRVPISGALVIGIDTSPDSFFSGLIDDVRIYDRVVKP
jgi:hypothetical protein